MVGDSKVILQNAIEPLISGYVKTVRRTHLGVAMVVAAILDNKLELCLKQAIRPMPNKLYAELFDRFRPLGDFASKITMAYALNIITRDIYRDLNKIRAIRNAFAHSRDILNFESESIAPLLDQLKKSVQTKAKSPDQQFLDCVTPIDEALEAYLQSKGKQAS